MFSIIIFEEWSWTKSRQDFSTVFLLKRSEKEDAGPNQGEQPLHDHIIILYTVNKVNISEIASFRTESWPKCLWIELQAGIFDSQASFKPHSATKSEVLGSKAGAGRHLLTDASKIEPEDQSQGWLWPRIPLNLAFDQIFYTHTVSWRKSLGQCQSG